jgi:DNA-binding LacI/PurR family transcriptional regulator
VNARLTMADIGRLAGVSASTVSRALSGNPAIPHSTRERILRIAEEHNYILDVRAKNFRLRRSQTIATLFPYLGESRRMISDPFYMEAMGAITDELDHYGYDMLIARVHSDDDDWCLRYVMNKRVDGIILIDRALEDRGVARLQELGAHFVVWGPTLPSQDYISVGGNSIAGAMMAVRHLVSLGRRTIGFVGGQPHMVETELRRQGYQQGLAECGLPFDERLVAYTDFTPDSSHSAVDELLARAPDLDGLFLCSDFISIAAVQLLRERGRRVPEEVSIVGYDDIQLAARCDPPLTTIHQPIQEGGRLMVRKLFDLIEGRPTEPAMLPVTLVVRDSCGGRTALT